MGSTLDEFESGSAFDKYYSLRTQILSFGVTIPITPDRRTRASYQFCYDFEAGFIQSQKIGIMHQFHCWEFALIFAHTNLYDGYDKKNDFSIRFHATLNGIHNPLQQIKGEMSDSYKKFSGRNRGGL